jgi:hypothetical protein
MSTREDTASRITRGVMMAVMAKAARALHTDGGPADGEYTRGQVELICDATGLDNDEHGDQLYEYITYQISDAEFGVVLAAVTFPSRDAAAEDAKEASAVTTAGGWTADELRALVMAAGELWDNVDHERAGDYLTVWQLSVLDKANTTYRVDAL